MINSNKLTEKQVEEFLDLCRNYEEEKIIYLLEMGYKVDEYLPVPFLSGYSTFYTYLLEDFYEINEYVNLPKITKLFYKYGMKEDYWLEFVEDETDDWVGKWDDDEHVTPYLMLSLIPFDDNVMETILIMMDNNLSQKGFNELVRDILENIINENYGAEESSTLEQYIKFIIFLSSFPKHLNNCKCLKKAIQFNDEFDYSYFRNINKFNFNINIERNKKTIKIKVDVLENNKIIYSFMYMYGN